MLVVELVKRIHYEFMLSTIKFYASHHLAASCLYCFLYLPYTSAQTTFADFSETDKLK